MRLLIATFAVITITATAPALALDLTTKITDEVGAAIYDQFSAGKATDGKQCDDPGEKPCLTARAAVEHALLMCGGPPFCPKEESNGDEKYRRAKLVDKIEKDPKNVTFSVEMAPVVKRLVGTMYTPIIVKQVWDILEPPEVSK